MCFDLDSRPPIAPIAGGALDSERLVLTAEDGNRFAAFRARAAEPRGAGIVVMPDVRGLHPYYEELALRFAEQGIDALAFDYFGRTAGIDTPRDDSFEYMPHVERTTWDSLRADIGAAVTELRPADGGRVRSLFTIGFCFGGRLAFLSPTLGADLAGAIGFYGSPVSGRPGMPVPIDVIDAMEGAILGQFGGADGSIPAEAIAEFDTALAKAGVDHRLITYPGAPHSFFDRKAAEFADASGAAWSEVLTFIRARTA
jgi:carboxymethylenebutenolidase